ncbi:hypothetical protein, partial [Klebsiella pneumoniae]|uniref:hypothetical protein n=1 Tax=Klebsiella pneumoniae TaxID=573 RepID=UPI001D0EBC01
LSLFLVQHGQLSLADTTLGVGRHRDLLHGVPPKSGNLSAQCAISSRNDTTNYVSRRDSLRLNLATC